MSGLRYHNITKDDMRNGDGLRAVLWLSGCDHACPGCQNPLTWDPEGGLPFDAEAEEELMEALAPDYISGLTLSGGDPLYCGNREGVAELTQRYKDRYPEKTLWIYTGDLWEEIYELPLLKQVDVLVDGPYVERLRDVTLCWKGSKNQRVIDVKKTLASENPQIPVIYCEDYYDAHGKTQTAGDAAKGNACLF